MLSDPTPKRRWPRAQRFALSNNGSQAEEAYQSTILASRAQEGRAAFEAAREGWAAGLGLQPDDGAYLCELRIGPATMEQLVRALEPAGKTRADAVAALTRLVDGGLLAELVQP
jgi:hypothetical protein